MRATLAIATALFLLAVPVQIVVATDYWPTDGWRTSTPEQQGMESGRLADLLEQVKRGNSRIDSVTVIRNGYLVLDAYFYPFERDHKHIVHSVTKSITSSLVGIALERGHIKSVEQPVLAFFPDRVIANDDPRKRAMTLEHLLTMTAGFDCRDSYRHRWQGLRAMRRSADWTQHVLDLPMRGSPGEAFDYCNAVSFLLSAIVGRSTGISALDFARQYLFAPLGISDVSWPADPTGTTVGYGELWLKPHDMAKFGWLYLNNGRWEGRQIVASNWVAQSTRSRVKATLFANYGYQWWRNSNDDYAAVGYRGQFIFVVPDKNMVVVFTSDLPPRDFYLPRDLLAGHIIPAAQSNAALPPNPEQQRRLETLRDRSAQAHQITWRAAPEGIATNDLFVRRAEPAFQF
ncbi:MAG: serine hydrolase [Proteobacteria bacterium]|nr:serine hydrolase [Pseudomonadota bacterium]